MPICHILNAQGYTSLLTCKQHNYFYSRFGDLSSKSSSPFLLLASSLHCDRKKGKEKEDEDKLNLRRQPFRRVKRVQCSCRRPTPMKLSKTRQTTVAGTKQKVPVKASSVLRSAVVTLMMCTQLVTLTGASHNHGGSTSDADSLVVNTLNGAVQGRTVPVPTGKQVHFMHRYQNLDCPNLRISWSEF